MNKKQKKMLLRIIITILLMISFNFIPMTGIYRLVMYMIPYLVIGYDILRKAILGILRRQIFDENFLMAIATVGAIVIAVSGNGDYVEAVSVMLFYQTGELFQSYAVGKSRRNISNLMDIRPDYANIEKEGELLQVDPGEVEIGSIITVQPGEKIPIDGVITFGETMLDTSALTGESLPKSVGSGDEVLSGCVSLNGVIKIQTTKAFEESTVSKILDLVENASSRKSRSEAFISRFARVYTPLVCILALAVAVLPPLFNVFVSSGAANWQQWIYRALTFLVVSCPCALVISIPLSFFAGLGGASKKGILIKGSNYLEALSKTECVVFDKTGTLTSGSFEVTDVCNNTLDKSLIIEYASHAECASSHPIGKSIQNAYGKIVDRNRVSDIKEYRGKGITASVDGRNVAVGNSVLMDALKIPYKNVSFSGTAVHVAIDMTYAGCILISDKIKASSAAAIRKLKALGVKKTVMLTGDNAKIAKEVAGLTGIDEVKAELLPEDKVTEVEKCISTYGKTVFVGDGINDAPVLSRADIGIAMGALGSDAAIEAADVVLMDDDPEKLAGAIKISKKCIRIVYENCIFAIGIKVACLILAAFGYAGMWLAIFADVGVMVIAVLNAIRALLVKNI